MAKCKALTGSAVKGLKAKIDQRDGGGSRDKFDCITTPAVQLSSTVLPAVQVSVIVSPVRQRNNRHLLRPRRCVPGPLQQPPMTSSHLLLTSPLPMTFKRHTRTGHVTMRSRPDPESIFFFFLFY